VVSGFSMTPSRLGVISVGVPGTSGGAMLNSLEFTSQMAGSFVTGSPASASGSQLLRTTDAGRNWHLVRI
jgi:photosystem II stability/assembly factor-like uncharacterized protein